MHVDHKDPCSIPRRRTGVRSEWILSRGRARTHARLSSDRYSRSRKFTMCNKARSFRLVSWGYLCLFDSVLKYRGKYGIDRGMKAKPRVPVALAAVAAVSDFDWCTRAVCIAVAAVLDSCARPDAHVRHTPRTKVYCQFFIAPPSPHPLLSLEHVLYSGTIVVCLSVRNSYTYPRMTLQLPQLSTPFDLPFRDDATPPATLQPAARKLKNFVTLLMIKRLSLNFYFTNYVHIFCLFLTFASFLRILFKDSCVRSRTIL